MFDYEMQWQVNPADCETPHQLQSTHLYVSADRLFTIPWTIKLIKKFAKGFQFVILPDGQSIVPFKTIRIKCISKQKNTC